MSRLQTVTTGFQEVPLLPEGVPGVDVFRPETWEHLVVPFEQLTPEQVERQSDYHVTTGGDMVFLTTGEVVCI